MRIPLPRQLIYLLGGLFLINLLQAFSTELLYDEAYYWYYSQNPAWGYFDHPPMVAWMIALGTIIFDNELGVRLISCIFSIGTIVLLWELVKHPQKETYQREFLIWVLSITLLHAYGFLSLPDTPLLFFTALFLWLYRRFLAEPGPAMALLLGLCMAALMYSKYHAALVILFVLFSNLQLLRNPYAWLALIISLICYTPHLYWLYSNDFVSIQFHLFERPNQPYSFTKFTIGFLLNLVALFGLTFPLVYTNLFRFRPRDQFERALVFLVYGFLVFFFLSSFQRRVQTQWLVVICVPVAVIISQNLMVQPGLRKWLWRLGILNIVILAWLRIGLVHESLFPGSFESHGNKIWVRNLKELSSNVPVVFENSYRRAAMYQFYSRVPSISLNNSSYRQNQYSIDGSEDSVQGKKVFYVFKGQKEDGLYYLNARGNKIYGQFMDPFESYRRLKASISTDNGLEWGGTYQFLVYNPYSNAIQLSKLQLGIAYLDAFKRLEEVRSIPLKKALPETLAPGDTLRLEVEIPAPKASDPVYARAVISENNIYWGINGKAQRIEQ